LKELALEEGAGKRDEMGKGCEAWGVYGTKSLVCVKVLFSCCGRECYCLGLLRDRKDEVMCKGGIIDYSVGGTF
jgi:hypothetical protein